MEKEKEVREHVAMRAAEMTVGELRTCIDAAIKNEARRALFMLDTLRTVVTMPGRATIEPIRMAVRKSIEAVKDEPIVKSVMHERPQQAA
jgi:hypothetical protein